MPGGWFFKRGRTNGCHWARNGWYSGLVVPISSIVGLLILRMWLERAESLITK